jgi:amidase
MRELCYLPAVELVQRLKSREIGARELLDAHLAQIAEFNPRLNALVTLAEESARQAAEQADLRFARGEETGPLHGLPLAVKDIFLTKGLRTTYGSQIHADLVPDEDSLIVEREKRAGAIVIGKSNTPEFAFGGQTTNSLFGVTRNPYDPSKTVAGSSGGAAAALAAGMVALADGSDLGGSLRGPAAWCNVVGFRPSPGVVPYWPSALPFDRQHVPGPMARCVADVALFLSAVAGPDPRAPVRSRNDGASFAQPLARDFRGSRIAWCMTPDGAAIAPEVAALLAGHRATFAGLGCRVEEACPELGGLHQAQQLTKHLNAALEHGDSVARHGDRLGATLRGHVAKGQELSGAAIHAAMAARASAWRDIAAFMTRYDFLVWPVNMTTPFSAELAEAEIAVDWRPQELTPALGLPSISVPAGFTPDGLPAGIQIIAALDHDFEVLQLAYAFEQATGYWKTPPPLDQPPTSSTSQSRS